MSAVPLSPGRRPEVSVIVPMHDVAAEIGAAIASLKAQTLSDFEALIIDDGSRDGSAARAAQAIGADSRFVLIEQANRGLSGARNTGLERARGRFIAFLDGDDRYDPRFLEVLWHALMADGGNWAASAIRLCYPDGREVGHSARHGAPDLRPETCPERKVQRLALDDACAVASLFPSAWNKLYRREFIGDLRFDEGTWYEDHAFFWRLVLRGGHLLYLPQPLYCHSRGRPGQITAADDPRVFEQFEVLETLAGLILGSGLGNRRKGLARLATRLLHERALVIRNPARRGEFLAAARDFLRRHDLPFSADWDREISRGLGLMLEGKLPLSLVLLNEPAAPGALKATLVALAAQEAPDFEILLAGPSDGLSDRLANGAPLRPLTPVARLDVALPAAAQAAAGCYLVFLRPGDLPASSAFLTWVNGMERAGAGQAGDVLGVSGFEAGNWQCGYYQPGLHDLRAFGPQAGRIAPDGDTLPLTPEAVLCLHGEPGAMIFSRRFLREQASSLAPALAATPAGLAGVTLALAAGLRCRRIVWYPFAAIALPPRPLPPPHRLGMAIGRLPQALACAAPGLDEALPRHWPKVLRARLVQRHASAAPRRPGKLVRGLLGALLTRLAGQVPPASRADQDIAPWLRRLLGLPRQG